MNRKTLVATAGSGALIAALAVPALSSGHTTISALQPQGPALTAQRTAYVVRAPNETPKQNTYRITMLVPAAVQQAISIKHDSAWNTKVSRTKTGAKDADGNPIYSITRVSWTARTRGDEIQPFEYGEFPVRFQNPATAQQLCFGFWQYYRNAKTGLRRKPEIVKWTGASNSDTPASCVQVVDSPPAP
jgi:hypothetical protein